MSDQDEVSDARHRAIRRRAAGSAADFDPARLALARRLVASPRTRLAHAVGVTPASITQYEKGQTRPTVPVVERLAEALDVPVDFFRTGHPVTGLSPAGAHFRSLRSTTALQRDQALSFGELVLTVCAAVELQVELPAVTVPELDVPPTLDRTAITSLANRARKDMGLPSGPVPHVVRLLEAHGVVVAQLENTSRKVDAFSHQQGHRPLVLLNPAKQDKARSRFDAAHELGHLIMHHDVEPGSRLVEQQAHMFAADFLAPELEIVDELPDKLDWPTFHQLKRTWGISLQALVLRAHRLGRISTHTYRRGMRRLGDWGLPEPGALGPPEIPVMLPRALELLGSIDDGLAQVARDSGLPVGVVARIWQAGGGTGGRPTVHIDAIPQTDEEAIVATGDIHTTKQGDRWVNRAEGNQNATSSASTKAEARAAGRALAVERGVEHVIHNIDGKISERNTYPRSRDPRSSRG